VQRQAVLHAADGQLVSEYSGDETSIGASKFYRVEMLSPDRRLCPRGHVGRDRLSPLPDACWIARSWDDPELRFIHLRPMGSSERGIIAGRMRHGRGQYYLGTGLAYMTASALYRMLRRPVVIVASRCGGVT